MRPAWWREFLQKVKMFFYGFKGFSNYRFTDREIETLILRGMRKTRRSDFVFENRVKTRESRFALFDNPEKRDSVLDALQKIAEGSAEETVPNLRNDLEQFGGTNDITFLWGNLKKGMYHIAYRRGIETLLHVVDALADGKIERYVAGKRTLHLVKDGYEAILSLDENGEKKSWLLTGWEINKPDAFGEFSTKSEATQTEPTFSRLDLGAGLKQIRTESEFNPNISSSREKSSEWNKKNTETLQFKEWFGKSKVVDEEGKPLVVYHGSTADFTEFSYKFVNRNGQADGRGFYFTDNRSFAEGYQNKDGKLFEVYLSIQKPLNPDKLTITKAELRKILDAIDPSGDYMANYAEDDRGYPGAAWRAKALNSTVNAIYDSSENNADILAELYSSFGGGEVLAEVRKVSGYDGFIKKDQNGNMIYIAFEPGQIKSATDNIGTYDRNNPDIRFSIEQDEDFLPDGGRRGYTLENARASKEGYRVERVNENAGREFNEADGVVCIKDVVFTSSELPKTGKMKWIKERLTAYSREHGVLGLHETPCLDDFVKVTENGIVNDLNHRGTAIRQNMIAVIPEMLKNAVLIQTESDRRSKTHILAVKVRYGDERFVVGLVVNENNGKYFYDHELTEINAVADGTSEKTDAGQTKASVLNVIRKALLSSGFDTGSGKNLRFSIEQYSDADWSDMVTYMRSKVGDVLNHPDSDYRRMLEEAGMRCYSEADAHAVAAEAMQLNEREIRERGKQRRDKWIYENELLYRLVVDFAGSDKFTLVPDSFTGEKFTGTWIAEEYRKYSEKRAQKPTESDKQYKRYLQTREKALARAKGYRLDEVAEAIARKTGRDTLEVQEELVDYQNLKEGTSWGREGAARRLAAMTLDSIERV